MKAAELAANACYICVYSVRSIRKFILDDNKYLSCAGSFVKNPLVENCRGYSSVRTLHSPSERNISRYNAVFMLSIVNNEWRRRHPCSRREEEGGGTDRERREKRGINTDDDRG